MQVVGFGLNRPDFLPLIRMLKQEDSIEILNKIRRDNNIGNLIGTAQRHNTNKSLKALLQKK